MRFVTITIFAVTGTLVAPAIAKPVPNRMDGMVIPLARHSSSLNSNKTIDLDAINSHGISVREKILTGLDNYKTNTGMMHPFAVERSDSESGLGRRGGVPLTNFQNNMLWMGEISIGTPPKTLKVQIDTGSADMWVLQAGCPGVHRDLWDPHSSSSAKNQGRQFEFRYGDGSTVQGDRYSDRVTIAGFTANPQTFGSATSYTFCLQSSEYADGLLGLAFPSVSEFGAYPLFASLVKQGRLINPTFSFKFSPSGAEMYVGGANSMLYNGDITYTRVTNPALWQVWMNDVRVRGNKILENVPVIFDTGANYIFGDWERVSELYSRLGGVLRQNGDFGYYYLPCDSFPTVSFTFGGRAFAIPPDALKLGPIAEGSPYCFGAILAQRSRFAFWNVGITFLQGVYSVFDYNTLRVGFANLA